MARHWDPDREFDEPLDPKSMAEISLRREIEQMFPEPPSHLEALIAANEALPPVPPVPAPKRGWFVMPLIVVAGAIGFVFRLLLLPLGGVLRRRANRRAADRVDAKRVFLREAFDSLERNPGDLDLRINLAVALKDYSAQLSEHLLDDIVREAPETSKAYAIAVYNRGVLRQQLRLDRLAKVDFDRAKQVGFEAPAKRRLLPSFLWFIFLMAAGIVTEDD